MEVSIGMVFAIIITIIIIGALLVFGFPQIMGIFTLERQAQVYKAVKDLEVAVDELYVMAEGSSKVFKLSLPASAKICFVNITAPGINTYPAHEAWKDWVPGVVPEYMISNPASDYYQSTLWIYLTSEEIGEGYKITNLVPAGGYGTGSFCARPGTELYLENIGLAVSVSVR